jgi:hypothetical protein
MSKVAKHLNDMQSLLDVAKLKTTMYADINRQMAINPAQKVVCDGLDESIKELSDVADVLMNVMRDLDRFLEARGV